MGIFKLNGIDYMGGGGGSSVIPNPQDPATDTLTTVGINGTVYDIAGGSGGSGYTETTLWSGSETPSTAGSDINLSENISDYDAIAIHVGNSSYSGDNIFLISSLTIGETYISTIYHGENLGAYFTYTSDTQINIKRQATSYPQTYTKVIGIKYGEGGGGGGGASFDEDILLNTQTTVSSGSSIQLTSSIFDYDLIIIDTSTGSYTDWREHIFMDVSQITLNTEYTRMVLRDSSSTYGLRYKFTANDTIYAWGDGSRDMIIYKITGIKFNSGGGGGNSNDRELTWDEYQALPDAEKYNDTNYYITDVNSDGTSNEFQPIIYSENEREIGVWTDGKPLYEITLYYASLNVSRNDWAILEAFTLDKLIDVSVLFTDDNDRHFDEAYMRISYYNGNLYYHTPESRGTCNNVYVTIQYTKTTDQPGSGTWTPQGVPAVHYDDNEKVIGTWFGETLYERVYDFSSSPIYIDTSYTTISAIDTTNIDKVIYCCAMHQDGTVYPAVDADPTRDSHTYMGLKSFDSHSNVAYVIIRYTKSSS